MSDLYVSPIYRVNRSKPSTGSSKRAYEPHALYAIRGLDSRNFGLTSFEPHCSFTFLCVAHATLIQANRQVRCVVRAVIRAAQT